MVQFNELRINSEGTKLIIDVSIKDLQYYQNVYLDNISIDTQDTFIESGPSDKVAYSYTLEGDAKNIRLELGIGDILPSLLDNMFFVWVRTKGIPTPDTPCGMDSLYSMGVTLYTCPIYDYIMQYVREVEKSCSVPKGFIDSFLQWKAFEVSIATKNYVQAIFYYNKFIRRLRVFPNKSTNCSCYG